MMALQALWTQARENLDVTTVIFSNRSYAILNIEMARAGTVTLPCENRERATPYGFSSRRDGLAPRGHRRGA